MKWSFKRKPGGFKLWIQLGGLRLRLDYPSSAGLTR
jgi:hypothetical protein